MAARKQLNIADWVEAQKKEYAPSSLDRYLSQPDSPSSTSPRWEQSPTDDPHPSSSSSTTPSSSSNHHLLSPALLRQLSAQYAKGELVAVRCNRHKWLLGEVRRLSDRGVRVWVGEAGLLVNVPKQLLASHLQKMSSVSGEQAFHSLPPAEPMVETPLSGSAKYLVQCVRPAHLSHRKLYLPVQSPGNACAICGQDVIVEDEAVAPWDCDHNCHIDCIQDKPRFFSTMSCPVCSSTSSSPATPPPHTLADGLIPRRETSTAESLSSQGRDSDAAVTKSPLQTIAENVTELHSPVAKLKPALKKGSVSFSLETEGSSQPPPSPSTSSTSPASTGSSATSLADRMKKFGMGIGMAGNQANEKDWLTVIRDGQNTRHTASQQRIEHMARAKENTFSAKAKQQQQQKNQ